MLQEYQANTLIHQRFADLANELAKLAVAVNALALEQQKKSLPQKAGLGDIVSAIKEIQTTTPPVVNINVSVYIILVNLNLFIWWLSCFDDKRILDCLNRKLQESQILKEALRKSNDRALEKRVRNVLGEISKILVRSSQSSDESNSQVEATEWQIISEIIENLCVDILRSFPEKPSEEPFNLPPPTAQEGWEEQLTEETLTKASPLIQQLSQLEVLLTAENLDLANLDRLETQLQILHDELGKYPDIGPQELVRIASEPLHDNTSNSRYHRLLTLQKLRLLILQHFVSK